MRPETIEAIIKAGDRMGLEIRAYDGHPDQGISGPSSPALMVDSVGTFAASVGWAVAHSKDPRELLADVAEACAYKSDDDLIIY